MCKVCVTVYSIVALGQRFLPNVIFFQNSDYDDLEKSIMLGLESKLWLSGVAFLEIAWFEFLCNVKDW